MKTIKNWWFDRSVLRACKGLHREIYGDCASCFSRESLPYIGLYKFVPRLFEARMEVNDALRRMIDRGWIRVSQDRPLTVYLVETKSIGIFDLLKWTIIIDRVWEYLIFSFSFFMADHGREGSA